MSLLQITVLGCFGGSEGGTGQSTVLLVSAESPEIEGEAAVEHKAMPRPGSLGVELHWKVSRLPRAGYRCNSSRTSSVLMVTCEIMQQETTPCSPKAGDQSQDYVPCVEMEKVEGLKGS
jgi:hypothetical protein